MRYMIAAVRGASAMPEAERPIPQAIINCRSLARRTVYDIIQPKLATGARRTKAPCSGTSPLTDWVPRTNPPAWTGKT